MSLPGGLYTGGAVSLNPAPYVNYYLQTRAHQRAQEDAMYKYFGDLQKNLTPAGMDSKDIPGLMERKNQWQQHMLANRDKISRPTMDKGAAYTEAMSRYNDMMAYIDRSKNKMKNIASVRPIVNNPQKHDLLTDQTWDALHKGTLPLDHPEYQDFDPNSIDFNPAPFSLKDENSIKNSLSLIKPVEGEPTRKNLGNRTEEVTHHYRLSPDQLYAIQGQASGQYATNPSFKAKIDKLDDPNGDTYHALNDLYKSHYGKDIQDKGDFATAYYLSLHPGIKERVETRTIPMNPWEQSAISLDRQKKFYDYKEGQKTDKATQQGASVDQFINDLEDKAKKGGNYPYVHSTGEKENAYNIGLTSQLEKIFSVKDVSGKHTLQPDKIQLMGNGDWMVIYYQRDPNTGQRLGNDNKVAIDKDLSKRISKEAIRASFGNTLLTKKTAEKSLSQPQTSKKQTFGTGGLN